jgi:putative transposon-encoded protein
MPSSIIIHEILKRKSLPEQININGEVIYEEKRRLTRIGSSNHVSIPAAFKRFFNGPLLEIRVVRQENAPPWDRYVIVISLPEVERDGEE